MYFIFKVIVLMYPITDHLCFNKPYQCIFLPYNSYLIDYVEELMRNVILRRKANRTYQLATGSRFSFRPPPLAENCKEVSKAEVIRRHKSRFNLNSVDGSALVLYYNWRLCFAILLSAQFYLFLSSTELCKIC